MSSRVWVYLREPDKTFLSVMGELTGARTRHEQIQFAIKLFRFVVPDVNVIPQIAISFHVSTKPNGQGPSEKAWVYLNDNDLNYIDKLMAKVGEPSRGKTILFIIRMLRVMIPNIDRVRQLFAQFEGRHSLAANNKS